MSGRNSRRGRAALTARSVIASTLLAEHPPRLGARALVRSGEAFGIPEGTIRVALSRMVNGGELTVEDGRYRLVGHLAERQRRQDLSRRGLPSEAAWDGTWRMAIVAAVADGGRSPATRTALRTAMTRARFGEMREGVWIRPANLPSAAIEAELDWLTAQPDDPGALAARLWDLDSWARRGRELHVAMRASRPHADGSGTLADAFVLDAAVLRHLQADPLLPLELLPDRWPGSALRDEYERFDAEFRRVWLVWQRGAGPRREAPPDRARQRQTK